MAAAELDVGYCRVPAPFDAYVTNLNIAVGEYARQGQQVFALVDNRAVVRHGQLPRDVPGRDPSRAWRCRCIS